MNQKPLQTFIPDAKSVEKLRKETLTLPSIDLSNDQVGTLELLISGALSPLDGYPDKTTATHIKDSLRLPSGHFCPFAPELKVSKEAIEDLAPGRRVVLRHPEGMSLAILTIKEITPVDSKRLLTGKIDGIELPPHPIFQPYHLTPQALRNHLEAHSPKRVLALWAPAILSNQDCAALKSLIKENDTQIVIFHESALETDTSSWEIGRIRALLHTTNQLPGESVHFCIIPPLPSQKDCLTLLRAQVSASYNCTHVIASGEDFKCLVRHSGLTEIQPLEADIACRRKDESRLIEKAIAGDNITDADYNPAVLDEIHRHYPPPAQQGYALFFTGLSGSGKSTVANAVTARLKESGGRPVTLLDGDIVRKNLSSELTFSREHRDLNIQRIGFVASQIVKNHGAAICAPIAPYRAVRRQVRQNIERYGRFIEIYISTPLAVCEARDRKGLYAKARQGLIKNFTGIDDPYEKPENAEIEIDTSTTALEKAVTEVLEYLKEKGLLV